MNRPNQAPSIDDRVNKYNQKAMLNQMLQQSNKDYLDESAKYMLEDPNIYQYDEVYDEMKQTREKIQEQKKEQKKKNYTSVIANIRQAKIKRDRESSISIEALAKKDRIRNGHEDEEKFVTSSYMKVMEENKKYEEEQRKRDLEIEKTTAASRGNMSAFNKGLFNAGFYKGGDRVDLNEQMQKIKQDEKIQEMVRIKEERMKKQQALDENYRKSIREQYQLPSSTSSQKQNDNDNNNIDEQPHELKEKRSKSREKKHKKDKKKKHHRSRSRSRSHHKKHKKDKKSHKKRSSRSKSPKQEKQKPKVPAFNTEKYENEEKKADQEPKKELTPQEKKQLALERFKQRKLQQQQQQQEQEQEQKD